MNREALLKPTPALITGIILAGGEGHRMGGKDKGWIRFQQKPLIEHVTKRLSPQLGQILISANRHVEAYEELGYPVLCDKNESSPPDERYQGPIAGILPCMENMTTPYAIIVPCDAPLIPSNLVATLIKHWDGQPLVLFRDATRLQPLFGLYHCSLLADLRRYFVSGGRKLVSWCEEQSPQILDWAENPSGFTNINTLQELTALESKA